MIRRDEKKMKGENDEREKKRVEKKMEEESQLAETERGTIGRINSRKF